MYFIRLPLQCNEAGTLNPTMEDCWLIQKTEMSVFILYCYLLSDAGSAYHVTVTLYTGDMHGFGITISFMWHVSRVNGEVQ